MVENCPYKLKCNGVDCDKDFCMRKYRLDCLYDHSMLTEKQRQPKTLFTDKDGTDLAEFQKLVSLRSRHVPNYDGITFSILIGLRNQTIILMHVLTDHFVSRDPIFILSALKL